MVEELQIPQARATVKSWLPVAEIEAGAMTQIENAARHPDVASSMAIMPDCHVGFGVTIGCVFPTVDAVLPNAVGVDIGCGMCALDTGVRLDPATMGREFWRTWSGQVSRNVPAGFGVHRNAQPLGTLDRELRATSLQPVMREKAVKQLGTLGGGNHFMEAQVDETGSIWLMVHSGSRHTGLRIADWYNRLAIAQSERRGLDAGRGLASLRLDDVTGQDYLHDMQWATDFALANRSRMLEEMVDALERALARIGADEGFAPGPMINIHHNFAAMETHHGQEVMVHRKGATSAAAGQLGIIPGSMGTPSYIVRGRGNEDSLTSCSHGAGRRMGRKVAQREITEAAFVASLAGTFSKPSQRYIDEAPDAYKDIETVISRQSDLVEIVHTLRPIITLKGDSRAKED